MNLKEMLPGILSELRNMSTEVTAQRLAKKRAAKKPVVEAVTVTSEEPVEGMDEGMASGEEEMGESGGAQSLSSSDIAKLKILLGKC